MTRIAGVCLCALALAGGAQVRGGANAAAPAACGNADPGFVPLTDLGSRSYRGFSGGLYPRGRNVPPASYLALGRAAATRVVPRGPDGRPSKAGRIGLVAVGMSNAALEFAAFQQLAEEDGRMSGALTLVDGAAPGAGAGEVTPPASPYWTMLARRIANAGLAPAQVQVVWLKEAIERPTGQFPADAQQLEGDLRAIVSILAHRYPNLGLIYVSSRTYGGYARSQLNPEPFAYDSGFAVKWTIAQRIGRRLARPWVGWGPYLWTDGTHGRSDGLTWTCADVRGDGTHPSPSGAEKVAHLLLEFFTSAPTARPWFVG